MLSWVLSAASAPPAEAEPVAIEVITAEAPDGSAADYLAGIKLTLEDGWKTAWRNPGAAGKPFSLRWDYEQNVKTVRMFYPAPERFYIGSLWSIGYAEEVVFPIRVTARQPNAPTKLGGEVFLIACKAQCVPVRQRVALTLPSESPPQTALINKYLDAVPKPPDGMRITFAELAGRRLKVVAVSEDEPFAAPQLFSEGQEWAKNLPPPSLRLDDNLATFTFEFTEPPPASLRPIKFTLNDPATNRAIYQEITPTIPAKNLLPMLALALLGGFILNLMPCVLPVLGMKVMGALQSSRGAVRIGFLQSASGIFCSFFLLWVATFALKASGRQVGWGFQFQQPQFLALMALVITLFAISFFGKLRIRLPSFVQIRADSPFAYGVFAAILATPCSAPFVGTAIGYALGAEDSMALAVFMMMALGFASPWLAVAAFPGSADRILPKSGDWTRRLRVAMGYLLIATAIWLLFLVYVESGAIALLLAAALAAILFQPGLRRGWFLAAVAAACLLLQPRESLPAASHRWLAFDEGQLEDAVDEGRLAFVDVTAEWCLTCLLNKRVLNGQQFLRATEDALLMRADWTLGDPKITRWMAKYQRRAVPLNIVFGNRAKSGIVLPEILSERAVLAALAEANLDENQEER